MNEVVVKASKRKVIELIILGIIMLIASIFVEGIGLIEVDAISIIIGINVYALNKLEKRVSLPKRVCMKINTISNLPPVLIDLNDAEMGFKEVVSLIEKGLGEYRTY